MGYTHANKHIGSYTKLPVSEIVKAGYSASSLLIKTPHKGEVVIEIKERVGSLFGGTRELEKHTLSLIGELVTLENEACDYLLEKWLKEYEGNPA